MPNKIVTAFIAPMEAKNIRLPHAALQPVSVDPKHPITMALLEQLPKLDDAGLRAIKAHMQRHDYLTNSMSKKEDVESWILLVDHEMAYRERQALMTLQTLMTLLSPPAPEGT